MRSVPIRVHTANALKWLGSLYRNPAEAIKEHVSNALDEHSKCRKSGSTSSCKVALTLQKDRIIVEYPYGMSESEFEVALQRVADSVKPSMDCNQIGQLGIGMFSFMQIGRKCTFLSRKAGESETVRVTLREGHDKCEIDTPTKQECLHQAGIRIVISALLFDPTRPRGPLSPEKLQKVFSEKFDPYLRDGTLEIAIHSPGSTHTVRPSQIDLPRIGASYVDWPIAGNKKMRFSLELYFDPARKGKVGIRNMGVVVVDDFKNLSAYGLEESIYGSGEIKGYIDADFLTPLPARSGFEENYKWIAFLQELDKLGRAIEAEVEKLREDEAAKKLTDIQRHAVHLAREILNTSDFADLELLEGLGRKTHEPVLPANGFDFVPASVRIDPGKTASIPLRACVPKTVRDGTVVFFSISDASAVQVVTASAILHAAEADSKGVVSVRVLLRALQETTTSVLLSATAGNLRAQAHVRVAPASASRDTITDSPREGGINYVEKDFEEGPYKHSRYVAKTVQVNRLNKDYRQEQTGPFEDQVLYRVLMIGKETIGHNDKSNVSDEYLERLLSFHFQLKNRLRAGLTAIPKRPRGRPRKSI